ncbi:MAG: TonB-dependent receptor [Bacteroidota bacterium]
MKKKIFIVAAVFISSQLIAQQDSSGRVLDEVTVTATKSAVKLSQTGKVITIIDRATIDRSLGKDLAQLLTEEAGVVINGATSNPGKDKSVFLRGAKNDYTVILINGIAVTDPSGVTGAFDLRMIPIEQIERIEIVKGAQSTLYGSNAVAGVINIITSKGADKPFRFYGTLSGGTYNTKNANVGINGTAEDFSYNVGYIHHETKGISEAKDTTALKTFDKDGFNENGVYANFDKTIAKGLNLKPFVRYQYFNGGYDDGAFADAPNKYESSLFSAGTAAQWNSKRASITGQFEYDEISRLFTSTFGIYPYEGRNKTAEIYSTINLAKHFQLLAGIDYRYQKSLDTNAVPKNPKIDITSPYLSLYIKNISGLNVELGGRYNRHSKYGDNFTYSFNPSYLINDKVKIFANIASAFRTPSLNELYGQYGSNADLKPEKSKTYEGGIQASLKILDIRAAYFSRDITDVIIYGPSYSYINLDKQKDHGFEIEPTLHISKALNVKLYYAFVDGEVTTKTGTKDTSYNNLIRRPKNSFGATVNFQVTPRLFVSTNLYNYGKMDDIFFDNSTYTNSPVTLKGYLLWNAYAEFAIVPKRLKVFADVKNITNANYYEVYGYSTQGTSVTAGISFKL